MFILLSDCIVDQSGNTVFSINGHKLPDIEVVWIATKDGERIACNDRDDARICLQALAHRLYAQEWNSQARCFVDARYEADDVNAILNYTTEESFPPALVKDVAWLVSMLNWSEESLTEITAFIRQMQEKYQ